MTLTFVPGSPTDLIRGEHQGTEQAARQRRDPSIGCNCLTRRQIGLSRQGRQTLDGGCVRKKFYPEADFRIDTPALTFLSADAAPGSTIHFTLQPASGRSG